MSRSDAPGRASELFVFALLLAAHLYFLNEYPNFPHPNTRSRLYLALAIAEQGSFRVDAQVQRYGLVHDMAKRGPHYYSDKPPGASLLLAPIAWLLRQGPLSPSADPTPMLVALRVLGISLPAVGFWVATRRIWYRAAGGPERGLALILAGALGTTFFVYSTHLFNHVPAALLLFAAYRVIRREEERSESAGPPPGVGLRAALLAGLLGAAGLAVDYSLALALLALFVYCALSRREARWSRACAFAAGAAPPLLFLLVYNAICFGSPFSTGFQYVLDPRYADAYRSGLLGVQLPDPRALLGLTLLPKRGLAYLSPMLLLAVWGWRQQWRDERRALAAPLALVLGIAGFASMAVDWQSGWSVGSRYLVAAIPFLLLGVAAALRRAPAGGVVELCFRAGACVGIATIGLAAATFPHFPKEFSNPLWQLALPLLRQGHLNRNLLGASDAVAVLGPWAALLAAAIAFLAFRSWRPGERVELRGGLAALALAALVLGGMVASAAPGDGPYLQEAMRGVRLRMGD